MLMGNHDRRNEVSRMLKAEFSFENSALVCNFLFDFSATVLFHVNSYAELQLCSLFLKA